MIEILEFLNKHLSHGNFDKVDSYLDTVDLEALTPASILAILSFTYYAKDKLIKRDLFLEQAEVILKNSLGEKRAEKLLQQRR